MNNTLPEPSELDNLRIVRQAELCELLGVSRATLHRMRRRDEIPAPCQIAANVVGWPLVTLREWIASRSKAV